MGNYHYLDNAATTPLAPSVVETIVKYSTLEYGNPSSLHVMGVSASKAISLSRKLIASIIGAKPNQIIFTSGATEANSLIIKNSVLSTAKGVPITTNIEHPSVMEPIKHLSSGRFHTFKVDKDGVLDIGPEDMVLIKSSPFVSVIHVNNEIGVIQDIKKLRQNLTKAGFKGVFHVDATQSLGKIPLNVNDLGVDAMTASAHKFHGPKGVGFLYVRNPDILNSIQLGGGQEYGLRSGTENVPGICAMAKALLLSHESMEDTSERLSYYKAKIMEYIAGKSRFIKPTISQSVEQSPYIISLSYKHLPSEVLLHMYEERGILLSSGSACSSNKNKLSHVLKSIGYASENEGSVLRVSFSRMTEEEDVDKFLDATEHIIDFVGESYEKRI